MSGASQIKRQWQHQTKMSRARDAKGTDFQEITQSTAAPAGGSGIVPIGSPLSSQVLPSLETSITGLPGLYLYWGWITFKEPDWGMNMHNPS